MTTCSIHTTNPKEVEIGVEFFLPTDAPHWIPSGFQSITFTLDAEDLEDDFYAFVGDAAEAWCSSKGYSFSQLIDEPWGSPSPLSGASSFTSTELMTFIRCEAHGCVYTLDPHNPDALLYTPLYQDGSFASSLNDEDWLVVDFLSLLGEEEEIRSKIDSIHNLLREAVVS